MNILVTGASGFIGKALCAELIQSGEFVRAAQRPVNPSNQADETVIVGSIAGNTDWSKVLQGIDVVIHLAARVHVMQKAAGSLEDFRKVNVEGTLNLARQAIKAGVRRFIFISSIKVNGESTLPGLPYTAEDSPAPVDVYGISKRETEDQLRQLADVTGLEVVIIRPPLVYGAGVKANFQTMMRWLDRRVPLPLGAIDNRRSFVALENLIDLIIKCIHHPAAVNQVFLVSDGDDMSTTELLRRMAAALGKTERLIAVPEQLLIYVANYSGKRAIAQRLCGSLQIDMSKTCTLWGWYPPVSVDTALHKTAQYYLKSRQC